MLTPPENSNVQMGPFKALPTTPPSNSTRLQWVKNKNLCLNKNI
jgi:hypothetical protein